MNKKDRNKKEDETAIVCVRCDSLSTPIKGAIIKRCDFCNAKVWMAPGSQNKKFDKIYCMECFQLDFNEKDDQIYYTKENIEEFNNWLQENEGYRMKEDDILKMAEQLTGVKMKKTKLDNNKLELNND